MHAYYHTCLLSYLCTIILAYFVAIILAYLHTRLPSCYHSSPLHSSPFHMAGSHLLLPCKSCKKRALAHTMCRLVGGTEVSPTGRIIDQEFANKSNYQPQLCQQVGLSTKTSAQSRIIIKKLFMTYFASIFSLSSDN